MIFFPFCCFIPFMHLISEISLLREENKTIKTIKKQVGKIEK